MKPFLLAFMLTSSVISVSANADSPVVADGATLKLAADGFKFTEGPASDEQGDVYFTDQPNNRIVRYRFSDASASDWMSPCGRSNGLYFVAPGSLVACADANNELWKIDVATKSTTTLAKRNGQARFNGPNDCWVDRDGSIYFTDPLYKRSYWEQVIPADSPRAVYRLSTDGNLTQVATGFKQPNGIIGDAEGRSLWIADIGAGKTFRFTISDDGTLKGRSLFCNSGSDGMTIDEKRNLYLTGGRGVTVYKPDGTLIATIPVPRNWTANVTFAGPKRKHLFVTAGDSVFTLQMKVAGLKQNFRNLAGE